MTLLLLLACTPKESSETCDTCGGECQQDTLPDAGSVHVSGTVAYPDSPPASGDHNPCWASWGVATETLAPENWVHNLEHGGVAFLYDCPDGCDEDVATLSAFVNTLPVGRALMTAYSGMSQPFAAVAWEHRLLLGCADTAAFQAFFDANVGNSPEDLLDPPPPSCLDEDTASGGM